MVCGQSGRGCRQYSSGQYSHGTPAKLPEIKVRREGERAGFPPDGTGLVHASGHAAGVRLPGHCARRWKPERPALAPIHGVPQSLRRVS
jgi:hypothetical protein